MLDTPVSEETTHNRSTPHTRWCYFHGPGSSAYVQLLGVIRLKDHRD